MRPVVVCVALLGALIGPVAPSRAAEPGARTETGRTAAYHVAQARQFLKNGWLRDAAAEIDAALALPDGVASPDVAVVGARVFFALRDLDRCLPLARRAADLAPTEAARAEADAWVGLLEASYGWVEVRAPIADLASRLQLEADGPVLDPEHRTWVDAVALELRARSRLPVRVALPAGAYRINGQRVQIDPLATAALELPLSALGARGLAALQVARVELGVGVDAPFGPSVRGLSPGPFAELGLTQPAGPVLVGIVGSFGARGHRTPEGPETRAAAWSVGARVGREFAIGGPLNVRPTVGVRYANVPGLSLACASAGASLACGPEGPASADPYATIVVDGRAVVPFAELSVDWRTAGRTSVGGLGVAVGVDHLRGHLADGDAHTPAGTPIPYTSDAAWSATAVRLSARGSLAF